jgi:hypothetical protein
VLAVVREAVLAGLVNKRPEVLSFVSAAILTLTAGRELDALATPWG